MYRYTVEVYFMNDIHITITNVDTLTYTTEFLNNKWDTYLNIVSEHSPFDPVQHFYKHDSIKKVVIING